MCKLITTEHWEGMPAGLQQIGKKSNDQHRRACVLHEHSVKPKFLMFWIQHKIVGTYLFKTALQGCLLKPEIFYEA